VAARLAHAWALRFITARRPGPESNRSIFTPPNGRRPIHSSYGLPGLKEVSVAVQNEQEIRTWTASAIAKPGFSEVKPAGKGQRILPLVTHSAGR
jgi:hypothetical protein